MRIAANLKLQFLVVFGFHLDVDISEAQYFIYSDFLSNLEKN